MSTLISYFLNSSTISTTLVFRRSGQFSLKVTPKIKTLEFLIFL